MQPLKVNKSNGLEELEKKFLLFLHEKNAVKKIRGKVNATPSDTNVN
jgi:hypothetical protein